MSTKHLPKWWRPQYDAEWERARESFEREREQNQREFGADESDLDPEVADTAGAALEHGESAEYRMSLDNDLEEACKFGFGARKHYGPEFRAWGPELEARLQSDWFHQNADCDYRRTWDRSRDAIRKGWEYANL